MSTELVNKILLTSVNSGLRLCGKSPKLNRIESLEGPQGIAACKAAMKEISTFLKQGRDNGPAEHPDTNTIAIDKLVYDALFYATIALQAMSGPDQGVTISNVINCVASIGTASSIWGGAVIPVDDDDDESDEG